MLVLRRKPDESVIINGPCRIIVLAVEGERVKLGIEASPSVAIVREELLKSFEKEAMEESVRQGA